MTKKIQQNRFQPTVHYTNVFDMVLEHGTTLDDVRQPEFFAHVARLCKPGDEIKFKTEDFTIWGLAIVLRADAHALTVKVLQYHDLTDKEGVIESVSDAAKASDFEIKHRGPVGQHSIIRKSDKTVVREGFRTLKEAEQALGEYVKALAA